MPCDRMLREKWSVKQEEVREMEKKFPSPEEYQEKGKKALEEFAGRVAKAIEDHKEELKRLRKRLQEATSESERRAIEKEIADVEEDLDALMDIMEEVRQFFEDLERRTIQHPKKEKSRE